MIKGAYIWSMKMRAVVLGWEEVKVWLSATSGVSHHGFHLILGLALTLAFTRLLRVSLGSLVPVTLVLILELVNEAFDYTRYRIDSYPWGPAPMLVDIAITVGPPLLIVLAARWETDRQDGSGLKEQGISR